MDAISVSDGKNLGRVCDLAFFFPDNKLKGIFVTGSKGFKFSRSDIFIPVANIVRIGEDVVLVKCGQEPPKGERPPAPPCPPPYPPCPPCPPNGKPNCPPNGKPYYPPPDPRRNFDDYE